MTLDQQLVDYAAALAAGNDTEAARILAQADAEDTARQARLAAPDALHHAARWYASVGVACFPLKPGEKVPATRNGFHNATTDADQIAEWWTANPNYNIGLPTGHTFDVLDIDGPPGYASIAEHGLPPGHLAAATTPRGHHYYYPAVPGRANKTAMLPGVDFRSAGGYVVAPPSRTPAGVYRWVDVPSFMGK